MSGTAVWPSFTRHFSLWCSVLWNSLFMSSSCVMPAKPLSINIGHTGSLRSRHRLISCDFWGIGFRNYLSTFRFRENCSTIWPMISMGLAVVGTWSARKKLMAMSHRYLFVAIVFWGTLVTTVIMSLFGMYPLPKTFAESRLTLYFAPQTALMLAWGLVT